MQWSGGGESDWVGIESYTNIRNAIHSSPFIWVDEHENATRLHNLLCQIRLRPKPAKPSVKKNLNWQE